MLVTKLSRLTKDSSKIILFYYKMFHNTGNKMFMAYNQYHEHISNLINN